MTADGTRCRVLQAGGGHLLFLASSIEVIASSQAAYASSRHAAAAVRFRGAGAAAPFQAAMSCPGAAYRSLDALRPRFGPVPQGVPRLRHLHAVTPPTFHLPALFFTTSTLSLPETKLAAAALRSVSFHPVADSHG